MSSLHDSRMGDFTRGGQVTIHFFRMTYQVVRQFAMAIMLFYGLLTAVIWYQQTDSYERYLGARYVASNIGMFYDNHKSIVPLDQPDGTVRQTTIEAIAKSKRMKETFWGLAWEWVASMGVSALLALVVLTGFFLWLFKFGASQREEKHLRGQLILEARDLEKLMLKDKKASALKVAGIPLIKGTETGHIMVTGSTGTGKSTTLFDMLRVIRARGERVISFSPSGDFIERFWEQGDTVLNPFDARCPGWELWAECQDDYHYDMIAAAMIPEPTKGDPFWNLAARTLVSSILKVMRDRENASLVNFLNVLTKLELDSLHTYLKGTEAAPLISPESEKTAVSIRATAATYARAFMFLNESQQPFHIRDWVRNESQKQWIFLNAKPDQLPSVRPVLSAWLEIFTNALMSLPADSNRRIWLIIDELPTLNKIPSLGDFLAQARKYGGCGVLAFQQLSQLRDRYGREGAETLAGLCSTWVCMRQNDPDTAHWISRSFGEKEIMDSQQGISYGAHEIRDGVSLTAQRKKVEVLLPSEISNLNNLEGFVRLPGDLPVGHFKMDYRKLPVKTEDFIPRPTPKKINDDFDFEAIASGKAVVDVRPTQPVENATVVEDGGDDEDISGDAITETDSSEGVTNKEFGY